MALSFEDRLKQAKENAIRKDLAATAQATTRLDTGKYAKGSGKQVELAAAKAKPKKLIRAASDPVERKWMEQYQTESRRGFTPRFGADTFGTWANGVTSFSEQFASDYTNRKDSYQSQESLKSYKDQTDARVKAMQEESQKYRKYFEDNRDRYGDEQVSKILAELDDTDAYLNSVSDSLASEAAYWNQWESEDAYNEYNRIADLDVTEAQKNISLWESQVKLADEKIAAGHEQVQAYNNLGMTKEMQAAQAELEKAYADKERLEKQISDAHQDMNAAKQLQQSAGYYNLMSEPDFAELAKKGAEIKNPTYQEVQKSWKSPEKTAGNIVEYYRDNWSSYAGAGAGSGATLTEARLYNAMTEDEVSVYNYLLAKEGKESADEYLKFLRGTLNARLGSEMGERLNALPGWAKAPALGVFSLQSGLDQFASGVAQIVNPDETRATSPIQVASQVVQEGLGKVGKTLYSAGTTVGNMLPSILVGVVSGGLGASGAVSSALGSATLGTSSAGNAYNQALQEGYSREQAMTYGKLVGASEAVLQYALGGISALGGIPEEKLLAKVAGFDKALSRLAATGAIKLGSEITEEELQLWLEPLFKSKVLFTDYEAPTTQEMWETALVTALSTGLLEGGNIAGVEINYAKYGDMVLQTHTDKAIIGEALARCKKGGSAYKLAMEIEARSEQGSAPSSADVGRLYVMMQAELGETTTAAPKATTETTTEVTADTAKPKKKAPIVSKEETDRLLNQTKSEDADTANYAAAQLAHEGETVVSPIAQKLMDSGMKAADAVEQAALIMKVQSGQQLTNAEGKKLNLVNESVRTAFTEATGIAVTEGQARTASQKRQIFRSAAEVKAAQNKVAEAEKAQADASDAAEEEAAVVQQVEQQQARATYRDRAESVAAALLENQVAQEEAARQTDSVEYADGTKQTREEFVADYMAQFPNASEEEAVQTFEEYKLSTGMGQPVPETARPVNPNAPAKRFTDRSPESRSSVGEAKSTIPDAEGRTEAGRAMERELTLRELNRIAGKYGVSVEVQDPDGVTLNENENGFYDSSAKKIILNSKKATNQFTMTYYFVHELTHHGQIADSDAETGLTSDIIGAMEKIYDKESVEKLLKETRTRYENHFKKTGKDLNALDKPNYIEDEVAADFMMKAIGNRSLLDTLAGVTVKPHRALIRNVKNFLSGKKNTDVGYKEAERLIKRMQESMERAAKNKNTAAESGVGGQEQTDPYKGKNLADDSSLYDYDFLVSQNDMEVTALPEVPAVRDSAGKVDTKQVVKTGMKNARSVGTVRDGKVYVQNAYSKRDLRVDVQSIRHGLNGDNNRRLTNARMGAVIGEIVKNAIPINGLHNDVDYVDGTYAMAAYATDSKGREFVAIITVEQRNDGVFGIEVYDVAHAVSGRQKRTGSQADTKSQGVYPIKATDTISIADFLKIVNQTHQSVLSTDVLQTLGEERNPDGDYSKRVKFSIEDGEYAPTFYSQMERVVQGMKQAKFGASSVVSMLRGRGVKAEEIKWSGIEQWLEGKKSVTKDELLEFIAGSEMQIEEYEGRQEAMRGAEYMSQETGELGDMDYFYERAYEIAEEMGYDPEDVRFDGYEGNGIFYVNDRSAEDGYVELLSVKKTEVDDDTRWGQYKLDGGSNYREMQFYLPGSDYTNSAMQAHWGSDAKGVIAHARMQDFETEDGKMLFIEEIQSDWHNAGHTTGYSTDETVRELEEAEIKKQEIAAKLNAARDSFAKAEAAQKKALLADYDELWEKTYKGATLRLDGERSRYNAIQKEYDRASEIVSDLRRRVPDAPFRNTYHEYVLKRLIRMAAEEGYDSIGWTTAQQQVDRWSEDYAEGYRIEYDQDIPKFLNRYGKQWGAKVGQTTLPGTDYALLQDEISLGEDDIIEWEAELAEAETDSQRQFIQDQIDYIRNKINSLRAGGKVWTLPITDAMRQSVLYEGQPRYSIDPEFSSDVDEWAASGRPDDWTLTLGSTGGVLQGLGAVENDIYILSDKMNQIISDHPEMGPEEIKKLPQVLEDPVLILNSKNKVAGNARIIVFGQYKAANGRPLLGVLDLRPVENGIAITDMQKLTSAYTKTGTEDDVKYFFNASDVLYADEKRAAALLKSVGFSMPTELQRSGFLGSIAYNKRSVNIKGVPFGEILPEQTGSPQKRLSIDPTTGYEEGSTEDKVLKLLRAGSKEDAIAHLERWVKELEEGKIDPATVESTLKDAYFKARPLTPQQRAENSKKLDDLIARYGAIKPGAVQRDKNGKVVSKQVFLPNRVRDTKGVSDFARTLAEDKKTPEWFRDEIERAIADEMSGYTYDIATDKAAMQYIKGRKQVSFEHNLRTWENIVEHGIGGGSFGGISKNDIALGEYIYTEAVKAGDVEMATKVAAELAAVGTAAGQVVQAMSLLKKMTPSGKLYYLSRTIDRLNSQYQKKIDAGKMSKIKYDKNLAAAVLNAKTTEDAQKAMEALLQDVANQIPPTLMERWNAWRYLSMLGNTRTHIRNILSNVVFAPVTFIKDIAGLVPEAFLSKDHKTKNLWGALSSAAYAASFTGVKLGKYVKFADTDYQAMKDVLRGGGKYNPADLIRDKRAVFKSKALNKIGKANSAALEAEDALFLKEHYVRALSQYLAAQKADVASLTSTPEGRNLLAKARSWAVSEAQKATFRDASALASALSKLERSGIAGQLIVGGVMPFKKTPVNILKRGAEYSPLGIINTVAQMTKGKENAAKTLDALSSTLTGSALMYLGYALARWGLLRATGGGDEKEREFEELQGAQPYSLMLDDGSSFTLDWVAPAALPLFVGAQVYETFAVNEEFTAADFADTLLLIAEPMFQLSMLDGLNNTLTAAGYSDNPLSAVMASTLTNYVGQAVPTVLGQIARTVDDTRRMTYIDKNRDTIETLDRTAQYNMTKIPGASKKLAPKLDAWGRADTEQKVWLRAIENAILPGYVSKMTTTPMEDELKRLYKATGETGVLPKAVPKHFKVDSGEARDGDGQNEKVRHDLTADEWVTYQTEAGQGAYELLTRLVNSEAYQGLTDRQKVEAVQKAFSYANEKGKAAAVESYQIEDTSWIAKADKLADSGFSVEDFIVQTLVAGDSDEHNTQDVLNMEWLNDEDKALLISSSYGKKLTKDTFTDKYTFTDPNRTGYKYTLTDEQTQQYTDYYDELWPVEYNKLISGRKYIGASLEEKTDMVNALRGEVADETREWMARQLRQSGIRSTKKE